MSVGRVPLEMVVSLLEVEPDPAALARAEALDREAQRFEHEARASIAARAGSEDVWRARAAARRRAALAVLQEDET